MMRRQWVIQKEGHWLDTGELKDAVLSILHHNNHTELWFKRSFILLKLFPPNEKNNQMPVKHPVSNMPSKEGLTHPLVKIY